MQYRGSAARNLPEIAQVVKVAHVLVGSVQRSGTKVRSTAHSSDARTDAHLWAEHYDRPLDDVFAIPTDNREEHRRAIARQTFTRRKGGRSKSRERRTMEAYDFIHPGKAIIATSAFGAAEDKLG